MCCTKRGARRATCAYWIIRKSTAEIAHPAVKRWRGGFGATVIIERKGPKADISALSAWMRRTPPKGMISFRAPSGAAAVLGAQVGEVIGRRK